MAKNSLVQTLDRIPPFVCYVLLRKEFTSLRAKHRWVAKKSKLSAKTVDRIYRRKTWGRLRVDVVMRFSEACGVNLLKPKSKLAYLAEEMQKDRPLEHLPLEQLRSFVKLTEEKK